MQMHMYILYVNAYADCAEEVQRGHSGGLRETQRRPRAARGCTAQHSRFESTMTELIRMLSDDLESTVKQSKTIIYRIISDHSELKA